MSSLYQLTDEYLSLMDMAEEGLVDEAVFSDTLEGLSGEIEVKLDGYGKVLKELEMRSNGLKSEIDRLTDRRKAIETNMDRMKTAMQNAMTLMGRPKIKTDLFSFNIQKNGGLAPLIIDRDDYENFPAEFRKVKFEPDSQKIREYLKTGTLEWARIGERGECLRIR